MSRLVSALYQVGGGTALGFEWEVRQTGTIQAEAGSTCFPAILWGRFFILFVRWGASRLCEELAVVQPGAHTTTFDDALAGIVKRGETLLSPYPSTVFAASLGYRASSTMTV